jgi:endonuclease YncB( thermonuclease family)
VLEALRSCQEQARRRHLGIFEFGDPDSEGEDDGGFPALGGQAGGRGRR